MNKTIALILLLAALAACTTSPISDEAAQQVPAERLFAENVRTNPDLVKIVVTRDSGFTASGCNIGLKIDSTLAAAIGSSEQAVFYVAPGSHIFTLTPYGHGLCLNFNDKAIETVLKPGQDRRYRITFGHEFSIIPG